MAAAFRKAVPDVKLGGPDTGTGGTRWARYFARHETGKLTCLFSHLYVGGGSGQLTAPQLIDRILSPRWDTVKYPAYYRKLGKPALALGLPYRLTELNCYVAPYPGVWGGNNSFVTALFALDCMHWWAAHRCAGVNFHTVVGKYNGTIYCDTNGNYQVYPIAYGIKAFTVGGHGKIVPVAIANPYHLDLTAYAVFGTNRELFLTVINKEHGAQAHSARLSIVPNGLPATQAAAMFLTAPHGNAEATSGITLGGESITDTSRWHGRWTTLDALAHDRCTVELPATSAVIVKISSD